MAEVERLEFRRFNDVDCASVGGKRDNRFLLDLVCSNAAFTWCCRRRHVGNNLYAYYYDHDYCKMAPRLSPVSPTRLRSFKMSTHDCRSFLRRTNALLLTLDRFRSSLRASPKPISSSSSSFPNLRCKAGLDIQLSVHMLEQTEKAWAAGCVVAKR